MVRISAAPGFVGKDLVTDFELTTPEVVATIAQRRVAYEEQQQNLAGIAAATPGAPPHVNVPWNDEMSRQVLVQLNNARRLLTSGVRQSVVLDSLLLNLRLCFCFGLV